MGNAEREREGRDRHSGRKVGLFLAGKTLFMEVRRGPDEWWTKGVGARDGMAGGIEERIGRKRGVLF
jgi:hypothetical protein